MGAFDNPTLFTTGTAGVDYVDLTFQVTVKNVVPVLASPVTSPTTITEAQSVNFSISFSDIGFDNTLNPNLASPPLILDPQHESFRYSIDWGDGRNEVGVLSPADLIDINGNSTTPST